MKIVINEKRTGTTCSRLFLPWYPQYIKFLCGITFRRRCFRSWSWTTHLADGSMLHHRNHCYILNRQVSNRGFYAVAPSLFNFGASGHTNMIETFQRKFSWHWNQGLDSTYSSAIKRWIKVYIHWSQSHGLPERCLFFVRLTRNLMSIMPPK